MPDDPFDSAYLRKCIEGWQAGDLSAANDLLRAAGARLEKLARRMTRSFPNVREHADTADVLQGSLIRLLRTLRKLRPVTTRDFFNLAAVHIRRELIDLARRTKGKGHLPLQGPGDSSGANPNGPRAESNDPQAGADFDLWVRFHEAVDELPAEEREVIGLVFYHGWTQVKIAELFDVDERTIRRRWSRACQRLRDIVGGDFLGS
jgi:RNA polymerase sigma-70 factor (ECF subfamily)